MLAFTDDVMDQKLGRISALGDHEVLRRWQAVGVQLFDELPDDFERLFLACVHRFSNVPADSQTPSLANWDLLGSRMLAVNPDARRLACELIVEASVALGEAAAATAPSLPTLTFARIARIAEVVVQEAEAFVVRELGGDEVVVVLEPAEAQELDRLQAARDDLVIAALALSLDEWSRAHPGVERVRVHSGARAIDVRVGQEPN